MVVPDFVKGAEEEVARQLSGFTEPGAIGTLLTALVPPGQAGFIFDALRDLPEAVKATAQAKTQQEAGAGTVRLAAIGIAPDILPIAVGYVHAMSWGMPGLLAFLSLRYASEGLGRTKPIMYIGFLALAVNVLGNWIFMYGKLGMPSLGAVGCGVSTSISVWVMFFAMLMHMRSHRAYRRFDLFARIDRPDWKTLRELTRIGVPIAGSVLAEGGLFVAAALMMGAMGATKAGGHQIALNYASFMFMVPLAISLC